MIELFDLYECQACRLVRLSTDSCRQVSEANDQTQALRRCFGSCRVHDLLLQEFPGVNYKRVYWLYYNANVGVRKRSKAKHPIMNVCRCNCHKGESSLEHGLCVRQSE